MSVFQTTPIYLKYIYKVTGVHQNFDESRICTILWCLPFYSYFIYLCVDYNFLSEHSTDISVYIEFCNNWSTIIFTTVSFTLLTLRRNRIRLLVKKIKKCQVFLEKPKRFNWPRLALIGSVLLNLSLIPFRKNWINYTIYLWFPRVISSCEILYLNDILNYFRDKFESINQDLEKQLNSIDFSSLFPLITTDKLKLLEDNDTNYKIQHIQDLSFVHYKLVIGALQVSEIFGITIILSLVLWFVNVIETLYFLIYLMVNNFDENIYNFSANLCFMVFAVSWLFVLISSFSNVQNKVQLRKFTFLKKKTNNFRLTRQ